MTAPRCPLCGHLVGQSDHRQAYARDYKRARRRGLTLEAYRAARARGEDPKPLRLRRGVVVPDGA